MESYVERQLDLRFSQLSSSLSMTWFSGWRQCDVAMYINLKIEVFFMDEMNAIFLGEDTKWYVPFHKKVKE